MICTTRQERAPSHLMLAQERSINHEHRRGPYGISVPRTRDAPDGNMPMMTCCYRVKGKGTRFNFGIVALIQTQATAQRHSPSNATGDPNQALEKTHYLEVQTKPAPPAPRQIHIQVFSDPSCGFLSFSASLWSFGSLSGRCCKTNLTSCQNYQPTNITYKSSQTHCIRKTEDKSSRISPGL